MDSTRTATAAGTTRASRLYGMQERARHLDFDVRYQGARDVLSRPHRHEYFQIQVSISGGSTQVIGAAVRPFTRGHLSFVQPYRLHVVPHPPDARYAIVNFDQRFLWPNADGSLEPLETLARRHPEVAPFLCQEHLDFGFAEPDFLRVLGWLDELVELNASRRPGTTPAIRGILLQLLGFTCDRFEAGLLAAAERIGHTAPAHDTVRDVLRFVRDHLAEDISIVDAAQATAVSRHHLAHLMRDQTGRSFTHWLTDCRLERAKEMLLNTGNPVREVAHRCGFADEAYFSRRFRQLTGTTPRAFRDAARTRRAP